MTNLTPQPPNTMSALFIFRLQDDHFLVADSTTPPITPWLVRHPPVSITVATPGSNIDTLTLELMALHGTDRVRGGSYSEEHLTIAQFLTIETRLRERPCTQCGRTGHYAAVCWVGPTRPLTMEEAARHCERCDRNGHVTSDCHETWDINGREIDDDTDGDSENSVEYDDTYLDAGYDSQDSDESE
jgi:hypothetical protein